MTLLATLLAHDFRFDPADPHWPDRDRLLLCAHHPGAPPAFACLAGTVPGLAFAAGVGQAIAERLLAARFGRSLIDHRVWVHARPVDLVCGTGREAAHIAGALGLGRLAVLATLPGDDRTLRAGYAAAGWAVRLIEPDDAPGAQAALAACQRAHKPTLILVCGEADTAPPPDVSSPRGAAARRAWLKRLRRHASREAFHHALAGHMPPGWQRACAPEAAAPPSLSTAAAVTASLTRLAPLLPDLATLPLSQAPILPPPPITAFAQGAVSWDGLDQAAPACLLGMALHGGILPVSQTHADVALPRAALAQAAASGARWLHTIVQAGSAGTMAPLPQLAIANLAVFEPADAAEALDCLVLALRRAGGPSVMALGPGASAPALHAGQRLCARGGYLVHAPPVRALSLLASGPGVAIAAAVHGLLALQGLQAALISMPCRLLWDGQDEGYRATVLGTAPLVAFAADGLAFAGLVGARDLIIGADAWPPEPQVAVRAVLRHVAV